MKSAAHPRSVLVIRLGAIGDIVHATRVISPLRQAFPQARITWLLEEGYNDLLSSHPLIDNIITLPRRTWSKLLKSGQLIKLYQSYSTLWKELRAAQFDLVLDLHALIKSAIWVVASAAPVRIALLPKEGTRMVYTQSIARDARDNFHGGEYVSAVRALKLDHSLAHLCLKAPESSQSQAKLLLKELDGKRFAVICPFTTRPQKHWLPHRWNELINHLTKDLELPVVILGKPLDSTDSENLSNATGSLNLVGKTTLGECMAIIERAAIVVGVDTGLMHMAIAYNIPTLALFGSTIATQSPSLPTLNILYHHLPCSPCHRRPTCFGDFTCMKMHSVASVVTSIEKILSNYSILTA